MLRQKSTYLRIVNLLSDGKIRKTPEIIKSLTSGTHLFKSLSFLEEKGIIVKIPYNNHLILWQITDKGKKLGSRLNDIVLLLSSNKS